MGRLTAEFVKNAPACINCFKQRELDLRGNKIPEIENLGATEDQYDVIDMSDNDIAELANFPLMPHLTTIFLNNNRVAKLQKGLANSLPNLETLILTNNRVNDLAEIDNIADLKNLAMLSLEGNPVQKKAHYRDFIIYRIPSVRILDFKKVKDTERDAAKKLFSGPNGEKKLQELQAAKSTPASEAAQAAPAMSAEVRQKLSEAILKSTTKEEQDRLQEAIRTGKIPKEYV